MRRGDPAIRMLAVVDELTSRIPDGPVCRNESRREPDAGIHRTSGARQDDITDQDCGEHGPGQARPVRIYSAGAHAIGAARNKWRVTRRFWARHFNACESLASLNLALKGEAWKGLALIDTPGISPADRDELDELKDFFEASPEIEKHLVLRAEASSADMLHMISRFSGLRRRGSSLPGWTRLFSARVDDRDTDPQRISRRPSPAPGSEFRRIWRVECGEARAGGLGCDGARLEPGAKLSRGCGGVRRRLWRQRLTTITAETVSEEERERLILEHLPQVRLIARKIHERLPESICFDDLLSAGVIGLIQAIDNFDPGQNVKLKTYAEFRIRGVDPRQPAGDGLGAPAQAQAGARV